MTNVQAAKVDAARILVQHVGWDIRRIAAAIAADPDHVRKWLADPEYKPSRAKAPAPCAVCGATHGLRNNGLCAECTTAKYDFILDLAAENTPLSEIARIFNTSPRAMHLTLLRIKRLRAAEAA